VGYQQQETQPHSGKATEETVIPVPQHRRHILDQNQLLETTAIWGVRILVGIRREKGRMGNSTEGE